MKDIIYMVLFITLLITLQSSSCNKTNEPQTHCDSTNTAYVPADARSRFYFKEGSCWVYKNILNNEIDSVFLKTESDGYGISSPVPTKIYGDQFFGKCYSGGGVYNLFSSLYGQTKITIAVRMPIEYIDSTKEVYIIRENYYYDNTTFGIDRFTYKGGVIDKNNSVQFEDSIILFDRVYKDILHFYYSPGLGANDYIKEAWYANKVGIVKMIRKDGTTWELINSKIIQ